MPMPSMLDAFFTASPAAISISVTSGALKPQERAKVATALRATETFLGSLW
ncbi:MAG: hypothetical protein M3N19_08315 [Candidatus Eremiobacteraeota bacterium]|nr:hypothetical protein [Candidatus Eremiobacteraeota bacterium]